MSEEKNEQKSIDTSSSQEEKTQEVQKEEEKEELSPDELMAQQFAKEYYEEPSVQEEKYKEEESKISMLLDIPLEITVEIGSTEMLIEDVLKLNPNSIIELNRYIDEPIDLKVNGKIIAKGELYTVKNNFGIKITHIITPEDRLKILDKE